MQPDWLNRKEYPFTSHFLDVDGVRMHYIDHGDGENLLYVHGTPSWSFDFRGVVKALSKEYRCIAADHIGFGLSQKPADYPYTCKQHAENLDRLIHHLNLKDITLVVHDFGGPIALSVAQKYPEYVKRIVVINSWMWSSEGDPDYEKLKKILGSRMLPFLYRYMNASARFILPSSFGKNKPPKAILRHYTAPFANRHEREGTIGFARSLLHDQQWFEQLWDARNRINHLPLLLIWGMKDPVIGERHLQKFRQGFPNHFSFEIKEAGHFPQEEYPELVAEAIRKFMTKPAS